MTFRLILGLLIAACVAQGAAAERRTWTDRTGQKQVEAEFVTARPGRVWLRRSDGEVFDVRLSELSEADQEHVRGLLEKKEADKLKATPSMPGRIPYGPARQLAELANPRIDESSGLACSRRHPGLFWTHNDSGGEARIFLLDSKGRDLGSCVLADTIAFDWEDMVSFEDGEKSYLVLCDVGNNGLAAAVQMVHVVEEPDLDAEGKLSADGLPVAQTIFFSYEDDHRNCEAVAVDATDKTLLFASKHWGSACHVYALPWPKTDAEKAWVARRIATLTIPLVTAMDISPDGRRAVVLTYGDAYEFVRKEGQDWAAAFSQKPRQIVMPARMQGESICYGPDGKTLYLTSEKLPTPLWEVPVGEEP
jgi:hypothetical protein